jgi:hypothetical protein
MLMTPSVARAEGMISASAAITSSLLSGLDRILNPGGDPGHLPWPYGDPVPVAPGGPSSRTSAGSRYAAPSAMPQATGARGSTSRPAAATPSPMLRADEGTPTERPGVLVRVRVSPSRTRLDCGARIPLSESRGTERPGSGSTLPRALADRARFGELSSVNCGRRAGEPGARTRRAEDESPSRRRRP